MRNNRKKERGFTLIELLIVMVILGLLAAIVVPQYGKQAEKSKLKDAKIQITLLETAIEVYRLEVGKFPTQDQGLDALRVKPGGEEKWDGPYLKKKVPNDPWGNPYVYKFPGDHEDYDIISYGADGNPGGEMDIASWKNIGE
ncbi:MAG: type II secretion system major pseudopilin GspG [Desulfobacterales bacterium]|nr:type II secretion system major pseudopilin GspG [Desulfobacterales bacterium]